jgi:ferredoxin-thioredoxin reductase catalytic chain
MAGNENIRKIIQEYEKYAKENGFRLNPEREILEGLINGLLINEQKYGKRYCPCRIVSGDEKEDRKKICPCVWHKEEIEKLGHCHCSLFVK